MIVLGISGGSGSGKTTFVRNLHAFLQQEQMQVMPQDAYYRDNSHLTPELRKQQNYDHPNAIEWDLMTEHLARLHDGHSIQMPQYSMLTCTRSDSMTELTSADLLIVEGILIFTHPPLLDLMQYRVFLDVDAAHRYERVLRRDMKHRGRTEEEVYMRYSETVAPMYATHIYPSMQHANLIVPGGGKNIEAARFIARLLSS